MSEINLLDEYPEIKRDTKGRAKTKTKEQVEIAKKFGWEYFDKKSIFVNSRYELHKSLTKSGR